MIPDYSTVTEITGNNITYEQLKRIHTRYHFASEMCSDKEVLEVACGSGQGLSYLANKARHVVGGDIDEKNLNLARDTYSGRNNIEIQQLDAQNMPFDNNSFDVVILYEAIYYLAQPEKFLSEAHRVLREQGVLIICSDNKDCPGFNPSPYSIKYFSAPEIYEILSNHGYHSVQILGDCWVRTDTVKDKFLSLLKKTAVTFNLMPATMKGKEVLKRIFIGKLTPLPCDISNIIIDYSPPVPIQYDSPSQDYKVLYALAYK